MGLLITTDKNAIRNMIIQNPQQVFGPPIVDFQDPIVEDLYAETALGMWDNRLPPRPDDKVTLEATVYKKDVVFKVKTGKMFGEKKERLKIDTQVTVEDGKDIEVRSLPVPSGSRGGHKIKRFSYGSAQRLRLLVRNTADMWTGFVTLTYPKDGYPTDGLIVKRQIHAFGQWLRRNGIPYVWIMEFQERGAPHFHLLVGKWVPRDLVEVDGKVVTRDKVKKGTAVRVVREGLETRWNSIIDGGEDNLWVGTQVKAAKNADSVGKYMAAYMSKLDQKTVPQDYKNVGRFWGSSRCLTRMVLQMNKAYGDVEKKLKPFVEKNEEIRNLWAERGYRSYAGKWDWKGYGFTLVGGADFFYQVMRQAFDHDSVGYEWVDPESFETEKKKWEPPRDVGQILIDGSLDDGLGNGPWGK